jgi:murein L,D-transpeptidase YcbB/YkuD
VQALRNKDVAGVLQTARPPQDIYQDLKASLAHYRRIEAEGGWLSVQIDTLLKPGQRDAAVVSLRQRLTISGDYRPEGTDDDAQMFDAQLAIAVKQFQRRHLLAADGIVGPATLTAMNQPVGRRIDQIRANLERMRWFLKSLGNDFLLVDIAGYVLYLVQGDDVSWSSAIQVGQPYRQTPVLKSHIAYLEWNPTWTVPQTILNEDVLPAIKADVNYLQKNHMDVLTFQGDWVDPHSIDWPRYPARPFPYMIRQRPGPWNALGTVKFIFPNEHLVYLHDTPSKYLFKHSSRAFSSGCIRVAKPYELAKLLLGTEGTAADRQIKNILNSGATRRQYLQKSFPVVLLYWTTKLQGDGSLIFAPDIYQRDARVLLALDADLPPLMSPD